MRCRYQNHQIRTFKDSKILDGGLVFVKVVSYMKLLVFRLELYISSILGCDELQIEISFQA